MVGYSWPSEAELNELKKEVAEMAKRTTEEVRVVVSPYRICPLGAHIDHQGGAVSAMTINKGVVLAFVPSGNPEMVLHSAQFGGEVKFRVDESHHPKKAAKANESTNSNGSTKLEEECCWGRYAKGAVYALNRKGNVLSQGIIGLISGSSGLDSSGLSSSAAVGVAYLLALENANNISVSPTENIEYDRLIENEYLGLNNGILDQSAILLSRQGCLTFMDCKTKDYKLVNLKENDIEVQKSYKILLACSGLKHALTSGVGYNRRVAECQEAARVLLDAAGKHEVEAVLSNVEQEDYEAHKDKLEPLLARRAEHYFSENMRVKKGIEAWASGRMDDFGKLITASGQSSIQNYECGCQPLMDLYEVLLRAPGVYGARFSGAGFRGCCIALVNADLASEAASFVKREYSKLQPELVSKIDQEAAVLICESTDGARIIAAP
ncbi:galacturonokinase-like [Chenopodium quinoa]|uniref:galacturonokinase-like n=1 Tax=Chenopodium quinoa TaxID=63459 RepID=UPI000B772CC7|nr:galacturonokinase-like [Chenopodium quinoa]